MGRPLGGKSAAQLHEERFAKSKLTPSYGGFGEPDVVPGFQLAAVLQEWTVKYLSGRAKTSHGNRRPGEITMYGPVQYLSEQSGIHVRRISGICNNEFTVVSLSQADALLSAIERPDLLGDEIQIVPNPHWSFEDWVEYMQERGCM